MFGFQKIKKSIRKTIARNHSLPIKITFTKAFILILCLLTLSNNKVFSQYPYLQFAFQVGNATAGTMGNSVVLDGTGNHYVTGAFTSTTDFDPGPGIANLTAPTSATNLFLAKYNASGTYQWAFSIPTVPASYGNSVSADASGNVYVTGIFDGTADFDPGPGTATLTAAGLGDIFVAKYDAAGNYQWAFKIGSSNRDEGFALAVDGGGNVYVTGEFGASADFDPGTGTAMLTPTGTWDIFVAKYNTAGAYVSAFKIGGTGQNIGHSIAVDASNNVYLTGAFYGTADFDPGAGVANLIANGTSAYDIFVVKYNSTGSYQWAFSIGNFAGDVGLGICVDAAANVYVTGEYQISADFDPGPGTASLPSGGAFIAKYSTNGLYQWAIPITVSSSGGNMGKSIKTDATGNVYVTGTFFGSSDFDPGPGTATLTATSLWDVFVAKYTTSGAYSWAFSIDGAGSNSIEEGNGLTVDNNGILYVTGDFQSTADFDPGPGTVALTPVKGDMFVAKYTPCQPLAAPGSITGNTTVCGGSTNTYSILPVAGAVAYAWSLPNGWTGTSVTTSINATAGNNGGYINASAIDACGNYTSQSVYINVSPALTPGVTIAANPAGSICTGTTVTFTATAINGGSAPAYQWQLNGNNVGANNPIYTSSSLSNGDIVTVMLTSNAACTATNAATSLPIRMTVLPGLPTAVNIMASTTNICSGNPVTFTATPTNGGTTPTYQWTINGFPTGTNSSAYTTTSLTNGDVVQVTMTSSLSCAAASPAISNTIAITVTTSVTPAVNIVASATSVCAGTSVTFTATPINGGTTPVFQWQVNGINAGTNNPVFVTNNLANGDIIKCTVLSNSQCATVLNATSNAIPITINTPVIPAVSIAASANNICLGTLVTFTATPVNGGAIPFYQWKLNGINTGTNNALYSTSNIANGDIISCILTNANSCSATTTANSNDISMAVNTTTIPSIKITASVNNICPGTQVTFVAIPANTGSTPSFQWKLNGNITGTNTPTYISSSLGNGDKVNCIMNTVSTCLTTPFVYSDTISMIVKPVPSISFNPSNPTISFGSAVQLNATVTGNVSSYLWTPATGLNNPGILNPVANPTVTTSYKLDVVATNGCSVDSTLTVSVFKDIYIPNSFTPDGDTKNDIFRIPPGTPLALKYFIVFDTYGNEIFRTTDITKGWDGTYKGVKSPQGAYVYVIKGSDSKGAVFLKGSVLVIR